MKTLGRSFLSVGVLLLLGWMLATPVLKINHPADAPLVADGSTPPPPPPFAV